VRSLNPIRGFRTTLLSPAYATEAPSEAVARPRNWVYSVRRASLDPALVVGFAFLAVLVFLAVFGPLVWRTGPTLVNLGLTFRPPSLAHPMGTDEVGRDQFARFIAGARTSMVAGLAAVAFGATLGTLIGVLSGAIGGFFDAVTMRLADVLLAFPPIILAIAVTIAAGGGLSAAVFGIVLTSIPSYARIIRSEVIRVRSLAFTDAVRAAGSSRSRILFRHILPNGVTTLPVIASSNFTYAVLTLAAMSYIGLGVQPPRAEWGEMITDGQQYALVGQWWLVVFPGLGLLILTISVGLIADRLRDYLDPRGLSS
jgi:peptide/nickel transport system permease protein